MERAAKCGTLSNAEIADRLSALAQLLTVQKSNPYKIRAYRRAAYIIRGLGESLDELVRNNENLQIYAGIGEANQRCHSRDCRDWHSQDLGKAAIECESGTCEPDRSPAS